MTPPEPTDGTEGAGRAAAMAVTLARERRWVRVRFVGWGLIGTWQLFSLLSEFLPFLDLNAQPLRILGKVMGLTGIVLIAYGFEKLVEVAHERAGIRTR